MLIAHWKGPALIPDTGQLKCNDSYVNNVFQCNSGLIWPGHGFICTPVNLHIIMSRTGTLIIQWQAHVWALLSEEP